MDGINITKPDFANVILQVVIVGAGANGSHFFRSFLQDIATHIKDPSLKRYNVDVTLVDKDKVEMKNCASGMRKLAA
ncbi:hypothetical protein QTG56_23735 (plasmid) [Rossellomorea sp. AcN35-11]|nr:hypothetical protein [Rossellomorea aquimaris]WJV32374.1 hypothetical protein QTG56_23735 [Rossellomorea sp. AcN35-11]